MASGMASHSQGFNQLWLLMGIDVVGILQGSATPSSDCLRAVGGKCAVDRGPPPLGIVRHVVVVVVAVVVALISRGSRSSRGNQ